MKDAIEWMALNGLTFCFCRQDEMHLTVTCNMHVNVQLLATSSSTSSS